MIIFAILLTVLVAFAIERYLAHKKFYKFADSIPMEKSYLFLGHFGYFMFRNFSERLMIFNRWCEKYPVMFKFWFGTELFILVTHPTLIKEVLMSPKCLDKSFVYDFFRLGSGLFTAKYDIWKLHRRSLNYAFNLKTIQSFIPTFHKYAKKMVDSLSVHVGKAEELDILSFTSRCFCDMIFETSFGNNNIKLGDEGFNAINKFGNLVGTRIQSFYLYPEAIYRMTKYYREEVECLNILNSRADMIIKEKGEFLQEKFSLKNESSASEKLSEVEYNEREEERRTGKIFIDHLICSDTKFTDTEIHDHIATMFIAGSKTLAHQAAHTLLLIATNPEVQEKLADEIKTVSFSDETDYENVMKLDYLERVIKESLRLCPVVAAISKRTLAPFELGGVEIPADSKLILHFYNLHRRTDIWGEDATEFDPDRFLPENEEKRHPNSFLPFAAGQRNCIGHRYAMIALKIMLFNLFRSYKLSSSLAFKDLKFIIDLTLKLSTKHLVSVERRN